MSKSNNSDFILELEFKEWGETNFRAVNKFYKSQGHKGNASGDERVFVALKSSEDPHQLKVIAAVRLVHYQDYYWLRSLYVEKKLQGNNIGSQLLSFVSQNIQQAIHCFPYTHLQQFYKHNGYSLTSLNDLPHALQQLYGRYSTKSDRVLVMSHI
jgi:N-acetylglutamate synthase-like GNAT family acetyltransferase